MCPGHMINGEFAGESGNLHRKWWRTENLRFSLISQVVENQRTNLENKKAERCVRSAKRQKKWWRIFLRIKTYSLLRNSLTIKGSHRTHGF